MVRSAKRAKQKRLAQEAQERESFRVTQQMDPANLSDPGTGKEVENDREIRVVPQKQNVEKTPNTSEGSGYHRL